MSRTMLARCCLVMLVTACGAPASPSTPQAQTPPGIALSTSPTSAPPRLASVTSTPGSGMTIPSGIRADHSTVASGAENCPITPAYLSDPADPAPEPFPAPAWHRNNERTLWVGLAPPYRGTWWAGLEQKARWWRRGPLSLAGRRLDGPAPPLVAQGEGHDLTRPLPTPAATMLPPPTGGGQSSAILFPEPGCWEIVARTPWDELHLVVYAYPLDYAPAGSAFDADNDGATLASKASAADAIVLVKMEASEPFLGAFLRQRMRVRQVWKGELAEGAEMTALQDQGGPSVAPPLFQTGRQYLLFLERRPGDLWRVRDEYAYGVVEDGVVRSVIPLPPTPSWGWRGETLAEADALLRAITP